jgi:valyl-tRNA synthetase
MATTRPETILGDSGVAVHPGGCTLEGVSWKVCGAAGDRPGDPGVADDAVQPEFGTGAVKVTPAHDPPIMKSANGMV